MSLKIVDSTTFSAPVLSTPGAGDHRIRVGQASGHGSTDNKIRRFTATFVNVGTAITYATNSVNGSTFTINEDGIYTIYYSDLDSGTGQWFGITLNSNQLTTSIQSITDTSVVMAAAQILASSRQNTIHTTLRLSSGDVIRPHTSGTMSGTNAITSSFAITKVNI